MLLNKVVLAIDFDGTIVDYNYPGIGGLFNDAKEVINDLYDTGLYYIIIWSCRSGKDELDMINFLNTNDIKYHAVNANCPEFIKKQVDAGKTEPRKLYYDILIDDRELLSHGLDYSIEWLRLKNLVMLETLVKLNKVKI
jgi:hypothetical protein